MNNFVSVFEELSKLYEEKEADINLEDDAIVEDTEDVEITIEDDEIDTESEEVPTEDEVTDEEPKQLVLECAECGTIVIKAEADVQVDAETDLVNIEEECKACEKAAGYKILGVLKSYEISEPVEESCVKKESRQKPNKPITAPSTDDELSDDAFHKALSEAFLSEGKFLDNVKKVATRVGADTATILRSFSELGEVITNIGNKGDYKTTKLNDFMEYVENKAALKALVNGNESVLNGLTKEDLEELKADIEAYEKDKADKKTEKD